MRPPSRSRTPVTGLSVVLFACLATAALGQQPPPPPLPNPPGSSLVNPEPRFLAHVSVDHADGLYVEGQTLAVRFAAEHTAHLYLLYHQADGQCVLLFPNPARRDNRVPARAVVRVPGPGEPFRFRIRPPFGTETLQVLAAAAPVDELDRLALSGQRGAPAVPPELLQAVHDRLAQQNVPWTEHRVALRTRTSAAPSPARPAARVGLFIGIGKYLHPDIAATHAELRHSAEVMYELLLKRGGLDPARTRLVVDEQATRANLENLIFRWLPSVSQPGDTVFLYFSGHAGQVPNLDGSEPDGQDEVLGPYDLDAGTRSMSREAREARLRATSIVDDTLARWLEELSDRRVVLILDTCHSGGVVEGKGLLNFWGDEAARVKDIAQLDVTVLTCCASDEQALFEGTPNKTMWFTYFLSQAAETLPRPVTLQTAYDYSKQGLKKLVEARREARDQEPTLTDFGLLPVALVP